jgi:hypothetical protein
LLFESNLKTDGLILDGRGYLGPALWCIVSLFDCVCCRVGCRCSDGIWEKKCEDTEREEMHRRHDGRVNAKDGTIDGIRGICGKMMLQVRVGDDASKS